MPITERTKDIAAPSDAVWALLVDVGRQSEWWPRCDRVETDPARPDEFTQLLHSNKGKQIRAEQAIIERVDGVELTWAMRLEGTPFAKVFEAAQTSAILEPTSAGTRLTLVLRQRMRGVDKLGGYMAGRAAGKTLDEALTRAAKLIEA